MSKPVIAIYICPSHPDFVTLCIEDDDGGTRVLGGKCCPKQYAKPRRKWPLTQKVADELTKEMNSLLENCNGD